MKPSRPLPHPPNTSDMAKKQPHFDTEYAGKGYLRVYYDYDRRTGSQILPRWLRPPRAPSWVEVTKIVARIDGNESDCLITIMEELGCSFDFDELEQRILDDLECNCHD